MASFTASLQEGGDEYSTVRFSANLLDYTVDERTEQGVDGSDSSPVKFEEDWTFAKPARGDAWQLVGIQQV
ncbi:MAG: TIM44-like domain-containing protein [Proteobacteria bacterium]|nr:TIM44-like domain-containing protein [Pseudomonadota bacterium]